MRYGHRLTLDLHETTETYSNFVVPLGLAPPQLSQHVVIVSMFASPRNKCKGDRHQRASVSLYSLGCFINLSGLNYIYGHGRPRIATAETRHHIGPGKVGVRQCEVEGRRFGAGAATLEREKQITHE